MDNSTVTMAMRAEAFIGRGPAQNAESFFWPGDDDLVLLTIRDKSIGFNTDAALDDDEYVGLLAFLGWLKYVLEWGDNVQAE